MSTILSLPIQLVFPDLANSIIILNVPWGRLLLYLEIFDIVEPLTGQTH
jgi:hypothetical protein